MVLNSPRVRQRECCDGAQGIPCLLIPARDTARPLTTLFISWFQVARFNRCAPGRAKRGRVVRGSLASRGVKPLWAGGVCRTAGRPRPAEGEAAGRIRAVPEGRERDWEVLSRHTKGRRTRFLMGLRPDEYEKNTPKDGVVDRIQIVQYPPRVGFLEPHSDPYLRCAPRRAKRGRVVRGSRASRGVKPLWAGGVCRTAGRPRPAAGEAAGRSTRRARRAREGLGSPVAPY